MATHRPASYSLTKANDVAREWLQNCERKHTYCKEPRLSSQVKLPRRLISIGLPGSTTPNLIETSALGDEDCRYAALSHCWGTGQQPLQTTASTISSHYRAIPWGSLPLTFRDAIAVTQNLGLRYLWIDSLCIIQGDQEDFEEECSRMHLIYLGSYVMIAASDAKDGSEGFLPHQDDDDKPEHLRELSALSCPSSLRSKGYIEWSEWSNLLGGPLSKRGWAFQECQLAPRILYYTQSGVLWECRVCFGAGDKSTVTPKRTFTKIRRERLFRPLDIDRKKMSHNDIMTNWLWIAEEYSAKDLTYTSDKLPALSGLAAATAFLLTGAKSSMAPYPIYLAGLWEPDLWYHLFWTTHSPSEPSWKSRFSNYPSWSWVS
ncbi:HET-domain-containing protein, partial [Periconia macrospinosa]